jgi:hypothetical protein
MILQACNHCKKGVYSYLGGDLRRICCDTPAELILPAISTPVGTGEGVSVTAGASRPRLSLSLDSRFTIPRAAQPTDEKRCVSVNE